MQPGQQLELFAPPKGGGVPKDHWSAAEARNKSARPGAQLELPIPGDVIATRSTTAPVEKTPEQKLRAGVHPIDSHHGGTYPMLMTGPEVRQHFQALDMDRNRLDDGERSTYAPSRPAPSTGPYAVGGDRVERLHAGERIPGHRKVVYNTTPETDDDLYARKHAESYDDDPYEQGHGLGEAIAHRGYDLSHPVTLSTGLKAEERPWDPSVGRGDFGKHQVLGGHHRVAVMSEEYPSQFLSVQWAHDISSAKRSGSY